MGKFDDFFIVYEKEYLDLKTSIDDAVLSKTFDKMLGQCKVRTIALFFLISTIVIFV